MWSNIFGAFGSIVGLFGLGYAFYTTRLFSKGVKNGALRSIRTLINRLEEEKRKLAENSSEWLTMHHTQQNLEDLFKNLRDMFKVKNENIPKD